MHMNTQPLKVAVPSLFDDSMLVGKQLLSKCRENIFPNIEKSLHKMSLFPLTWNKLRGHVGLGFPSIQSVHPSDCPSIMPYGS